MHEKQVRTAELARLTGISQPALHRIVEGETTKPTLSTLKILADYFGISVKQLAGHDAIPWLPIQLKVPILEYSDLLKSSCARKDNLISREVLYLETPLNSNAFAIKMPDSSMEPNFPKGCILVFDPDKIFHTRSFVLIHLKHPNSIIFRQLFIEEKISRLMPLSLGCKEYKMLELIDNEYKILGVLTQARMHYE